MLLAMAGRIVDMLRQLVEDDVLVTDFRLSNIVTQNPTMDEFRLWFVDTASIAIGQARPASSFVILAVHFRDQINTLPPLAAALREFAAVHATLEPITSLRIPVGVAIALSAKISIAQLLRFSEVSVGPYFTTIPLHWGHGVHPHQLLPIPTFIHCYPCALLPIIGTLSRLLYNISMKSTEFVTLTLSSRTSVSPTIQGLCLIISTYSNPSRAFSLCTDERGWSNHHSNVEATVPPSRG